MAGDIRGITVKIGGDTTELGKAIADSEKQSKSLGSELKEVNKLLKFNPDSAELMAQKQEILTDAVAATTEKLDILKDAESQIVEQFEKDDIGKDTFRAFKREIVQTKSILKSFESQLNGMGDSMDTVADDSKGAQTALDKLTSEIEQQETELEALKEEYTNIVLEQGKSSTEAKELASKMSSLNGSLKKSKKALSDAESEADDLSDALDSAGDSAGDTDGGFTIMKGALADLTANAIAGAVSAIGDFIGALMALDEETEEYRSMQAKLAGSSDSFGYSVEFATEKYRQFYGYLGDDQMATNAITNLMGLGTSTESVSALAEGAIGVWASYGDSIPIEGLTEAINETIQCGQVTGTFADTINWCSDANTHLSNALSGNKKAQNTFNKELKNGATAEEAFSAALTKVTNEQERAEIVATFLNDAYGESKTKYDELADGAIAANQAELDLKDTQAQLGLAVEPVNTALTNMKNQALIAITPIVQSLADAFMNLYNWLQQHPTVMTILTAIAIALAAAFTVLATALAIQGLITGVTKAFALLNTTILANPIVLIIAAIAALVAAFIYLWNNCEGFRQFWINLWNTVKTCAQTAWAAISSFFSLAWTKIQTVWAAAQPYFTTIWTAIKLVFSTVVSFLSGVFRTAWAVIKVIWSAVAGYFQNVWNTISGIFAVVKDVLSGNFSDAWEGIKSIVSGWSSYFRTTWNAIKGVFMGVGTWFRTKFQNAWTSIKGVFATWGTFFSGLWDTISSTFSDLGTKIGGAIGGAVKAGINGILNWVESTINDAIDLINGAIDLINAVPGVNVGHIETVAIPRLAKGGIVDSPTLAEIGENGREAIVPLENNTGWMREVAQRLNEYQSPNVNNNALLAKLDNIYDRLNRLQIVLDTGTLVGETIDQIDAKLANNQLLRARGV